jgi:hypothetical protein
MTIICFLITIFCLGDAGGGSPKAIAINYYPLFLAASELTHYEKTIDWLSSNAL